jgi:hypothetical protein
MPEPLPPVQFRQSIAYCRRLGWAFAIAWDEAWKACKWPHDTTHRRDWKVAMEETRGEWEAAYVGGAEELEPFRRLHTTYRESTSSRRVIA